MIHRHVTNIDEKTKYRKRITKQIAKTSNSIRKKYRALKAGKMEEDIAFGKNSSFDNSLIPTSTMD